jgi:hypothetical protein
MADIENARGAFELLLIVSAALPFRIAPVVFDATIEHRMCKIGAEKVRWILSRVDVDNALIVSN